MTPIKKWLLALTASSLIATLGLAAFLYQLAQDYCLNAGGHWAGIFAGCENAHYSLSAVTSPLAIIIFVGIIYSLASALIQFHKMISK